MNTWKQILFDCKAAWPNIEDRELFYNIIVANPVYTAEEKEIAKQILLSK